MKVVIDIDENYYEIIKHDVNNGMDYLPCVLIAEGTPLPKGHEDLISRQAVLKILSENRFRYNIAQEGYNGGQVLWSENLYTDTVRTKIEKLPSTEKTAEWEWVQYESLPDFGNYHCSECRHIEHEIDGYNYCPNCGADMRKESKKK